MVCDSNDIHIHYSTTLVSKGVPKRVGSCRMFGFFFLLSVVSAAVPEPTTTRTTPNNRVVGTPNTTTTTTELVPTNDQQQLLRGGGGGGDLQQQPQQGSRNRMQDTTVKDPWSRMGGGAINEKPRRGTTLHHQQPPHVKSSLPQQAQAPPRTHGFDPQTHQAHLYHALEGLHRYPNYLSRFSDESDLDALEQALQQQLQTVQSQRQRQRRHKQAWQQLVADYWKEHNDRTAAPPPSSSSPQQQDTKDQLHTDKDDDDDDTKQFNDKKRMDLLLQEGPTSWEQLIHYVLHPRLVQTLLFQSPQFRVSSSSNKKKKKQRPTIHQVLTGTVSIHYTAGSLEQFLYRHGANNYDDDDDDDDSMDEDSMNDDDTMTSVSFPLLQREFCNAIVQYRQGLVDRVSRRQQEQEQQLSSSSSCPDSDDDCLLLASLLRRPLDLDTIGLSWINDLLLQLVVRPLARHLYSNHHNHNKGNGWDLDWRQGYIAAYAPQPGTTWDKPRQHLVTHTDDSEVTLNLGLGPHKRLQGSGAVELRGIRGGTAETEGRLVHSYHPRQGRALLHIGRRFHNVTPVHHGNRYALILWTRSCTYPYRPTRERKRKTAFKYESIVFCLWCVIRTDSFHMCVRNSVFFLQGMESVPKRVPVVG